MEYNYHEAVKADVTEYITENLKHYTFDDVEDLANQLEQDLWIDDSVTGNASGSYTFSTWKAEDYLSHNWDLLAEALREFGCDDVNALEKGAEWCDVLIRCYLLNGCIWEALESMPLDDVVNCVTK